MEKSPSDVISTINKKLIKYSLHFCPELHYTGPPTAYVAALHASYVCNYSSVRVVLGADTFGAVTIQTDRQHVEPSLMTLRVLTSRVASALLIQSSISFWSSGISVWVTTQYLHASTLTQLTSLTK